MPAAKKEAHQRAIELRKQGMTYPEIAEELSVAKSTLSLWLRDVEVPAPLKEQMTACAVQRRAKTGAAGVRHAFRRKRAVLLEEARLEFADIDLTFGAAAIAGAALYWAEGTKNRHSFIFCNSNVAMIDFYVKWVTRVLGAPLSDLRFSVQYHVADGVPYRKLEGWWARRLGVSRSQFRAPIALEGKNSKKRNRLPHGILSVRVVKGLRYHAKLSALVEKLGAGIEAFTDDMPR